MTALASAQQKQRAARFIGAFVSEKERNNVRHTFKTVARTLFYQFFLLFVGASLGFILNAEYVGWKSMLVEQSVENIFFPVQYDARIEEALLGIGRMRLNLHHNDDPFNDTGIEIVDEFIWGEEVYNVRYRYVEKEGEEPVLYDFRSRIRWKPWEYYFEFHPVEGAQDFGTITQPSQPAPVAPQAPNNAGKPAPKPSKPHEPWPHFDESGKPIPGPVHKPEHPSNKPWWSR
jgi:hypothetical protein